MPSRSRLELLSFMIILFGVYGYLVLTSVPSANALKLGLGNDAIRMAVSFVFVLPMFTSFYFGFLSSELLFKAKFRSFAIAILILTLILLCNSLLGQVRSHYFTEPSMQKFFIIITNYIYTFGYLIAFYLLFSGTRQLLPGRFKRWNITASVFVIILIGLFYALMLFTNPDRTVATIPGGLASTYLSDPLIFLTIFLPTVTGWFLGILAAFSLVDTFDLQGTPDREKGFVKILYGLLLIIFSSIILQILISVGTKRILDIGLPLILGLL